MLPITLLPRSDGPVDCTTQYSGDYYGFGVRMGVYFAWFSSYLANCCLASEVSGALDTNCFFLLALLISLFHGTMTGDLVEVDALIGMHLSSGFIFSSLSIWGYRSLHYAREGPRAIHYFGRFGTHCRLILTTAISVYGAWFWWRGVNGGLPSSTIDDCQEVYTWFLHTWPTHGGIHVLYILMTLSCSLYFASMCFVAVGSIIYRLLSLKERLRYRFQTGYNHAELVLIFKFFRVFSICWIAFCIIMTELTINKNHLLDSLPNAQNVGSPAQLIPLLVGILTFVRVLFLLYVDSTGRFGQIWRFDANDEGVHPQAFLRATGEGGGEGDSKQARQQQNQTSKARKGIKNMLVRPSMPRRTTTDYTAAMAQRAWWRRYLVGFLPWMSVFELWRAQGPPRAAQDVEGGAAGTDRKRGAEEGEITEFSDVSDASAAAAGRDEKGHSVHANVRSSSGSKDD